jgi:GGDEF domain-containing protein
VGVETGLAQLQLDPVTGFGSRAAMLAELERAVEPGSEPRVLAIFSLDGSGEFREELGEEASNEVIARLAHEFARFICPDGSCFAPRRHEFAALFSLPWPKVETIIAAAAIAVRREGALFSISTTFGVAHLPVDADTPVGALMVADQRRVAAQRRRRQATSL